MIMLACTHQKLNVSYIMMILPCTEIGTIPNQLYALYKNTLKNSNNTAVR